MRKKEILPFVTTWIDLEIVTLGEKSSRKINTVFHDTTYTCKKSQTCRSREQTSGYQKLRGGGTGEVQFKGVNFLSVDKLSSGNLMPSTIIKGISWRNQFQFQKPVSVPDNQNK